MKNNKPELLVPAGSLQKLQYAFAYGADAVYAGVPLFSLRARENEFNLEELKKAVQYTHDLKKKIYLTANVFARNVKIKPFLKQLPLWMELQPDALIMSDPGLMTLVREHYPEVPIHLSVQANCMNYESVKFWKKMGVSRIILSRELRLEELQEIHHQVPDIEIEAFVHGSICIAYSGRCLLSHYMSRRDANQGVCDNSCRYPFHIHQRTESEEYFLEDFRTPGEMFQIDEDPNGTYIMNARDLCLIEHLDKIASTGVCSFKIEGRTKSVYYVAMVTRAYRKAIDEMHEGKPFSFERLQDVQKISNRGYDTGFMLGQTTEQSQMYEGSNPRLASQKFVGLFITKNTQNQRARIEVRSRITRGDKIEVVCPFQESFYFQVGEMFTLEGQSVETVHGGTGVFEFEVDFDFPQFSILSLCPLE